MQIPSFDLTTFVRNIYPGLLAVLLLHVLPSRPREVQKLLHTEWAIVAFVIVFGFLFNAFNRAILYRYVIRTLERFTCRVPQWQFHEAMVQEIANEEKRIDRDRIGDVKRTHVADACSSYVISRSPAKSSISTFNAFTHLMFMTSWLGFAFAALSCQYRMPSLIVSVSLMVLAIIHDHYEADMREVVILSGQSLDYKNLLTEYWLHKYPKART